MASKSKLLLKGVSLLGGLVIFAVVDFPAHSLDYPGGSPPPPPSSQVPVGNPPDLTCQQAEDQIRADRFANVDEKFVVQTKAMKCTTEQFNQAHATDPDNKKQVAYMTLNPDQQNPDKVLFGTMTLEQAKQGNSLCKILVGGFVASQIPDPTVVALVGGLGSYRCNQYFDLAVNSNPMLIVFPTMVPEMALTAQIIGNAKDAAPKLAAYYTAHPQDLLTIGFNPVAQANIIQQGAALLPGPVAHPIQEGVRIIGNGLTCVVSLFHHC